MAKLNDLEGIKLIKEKNLETEKNKINIKKQFVFLKGKHLQQYH